MPHNQFLERKRILLRYLDQCAEAAITKLDDFNNRNLFLKILESGSPIIGDRTVWVFLRPLFLAVFSHCLPHGLSSVHAHSWDLTACPNFFFLQRHQSDWIKEVIFFKLDYFFNSPVSKYSHSLRQWELQHQHKHFEGTQFTHNGM